MDLNRAALFASAAAADCEITDNIPTPDPRKRLMEPGEIAGLNKTFKIPVENVEDKQPKETDKPKIQQLRGKEGLMTSYTVLNAVWSTLRTFLIASSNEKDFSAVTNLQNKKKKE
ncbi:hypothetical protein TNCV_133141 [Trichonephila clavipes]|nr:hypothetical protein TNCV_133141 [Trichonephila clavipes]